MALSLGLANAAYAVDFSGHWVGSGQIIEVVPFVGTKTSPCARIEISIEHLTEKLTTKHYKADCGFVGPDWGPNVMEIRGTEVFEDDEKTGTLIDDTLLTLDASGGVQYAYNLRLKKPAEGQPEVLESYYGVKSMAGTIVIEGGLKRVP